MLAKVAKMPPPPGEDENEYLETARKVRSGEYFREARAMYDFTVHDPMAERYLYILITFVALLVLLAAQVAAGGLYPLNTPVPLIVNTSNPYEDIPRLKSLATADKEDPSRTVLNFMVQQYVTLREEYSIETFDRNVNGVRSQSTPEVFQEFQARVDPRNPESPITLYQRHSQRRIAIVDIAPAGDGMEVTYDATVEGKTETKRSRWRVGLTFQYSGVELDEKTGKVKPARFIVTSYRSKRLQDSQ